MAMRFGSISAKDIALAAATAKTVLQLASVNIAIRLTELTVGFDGILNTAEPVTIELLRQTSAGTMTNLAPVKADDSIADALNTTGQHTATVEPTAGDVLRTLILHPQTSQTWTYGIDLVLGRDKRLGLRITAPAIVNCNASLAFEE